MDTLHLVLAILFLIVWLFINCYGTYAYVKLARMPKVQQCTKDIGLMSVLLGWFLLLPFNLFRPITLNQIPNQK